jgi:hypothetical protein
MPANGASSRSDPRKTFLHDLHRDRGATFTPLPPEREHQGSPRLHSGRGAEDDSRI